MRARSTARPALQLLLMHTRLLTPQLTLAAAAAPRRPRQPLHAPRPQTAVRVSPTPLTLEAAARWTRAQHRRARAGFPSLGWCRRMGDLRTVALMLSRPLQRPCRRPHGRPLRP